MKLSKFQHKIYDIVMSVLAVIAVLLVLVDLSQDLNEWQLILDRIILLIFTIDYVVRFIFAPKKMAFVKSNICDLIAIIPFYTVFRSFKIAALARFSIYAKLPRAFAFLYRPLRKAQRFFNTNGFKYVVFVTVIMIAVGGILIHFAEGMSYGDGIWWAFVTTTTVGYGDISPTTLYGRIIAMILMLLGIGLLGTITSTLTSYFLKAGSGGVRNETLESIKSQLDHFEDLSEQDVKDICVILQALKAPLIPVQNPEVPSLPGAARSSGSAGSSGSSGSAGSSGQPQNRQAAKRHRTTQKQQNAERHKRLAAEGRQPAEKQQAAQKQQNAEKHKRLAAENRPAANSQRSAKKQKTAENGQPSL